MNNDVMTRDGPRDEIGRRMTLKLYNTIYRVYDASWYLMYVNPDNCIRRRVQNVGKDHSTHIILVYTTPPPPLHMRISNI